MAWSLLSVRMRRPTLLLLSLACAAACLAQDCDRSRALAAYESEYLGTNTTRTQLAWTGSADDCDPGEPSALAVDHALRRVNYYRAACGLPPVQLNAEWSAKAQQAALMMHAEGGNDHSPDSNYACFTGDGRQAAGKSNLYTGSWGAHAVAGYIRDPGANNWAVGHRRWILHPPKQFIGMGFTDRADAMWVIGGPNDRPDTPDGVAWPPAGYVPSGLVHPRWSFSRHRADFKGAQVTMTGPRGEAIPLTQNELKGGFGDNTLVWEPDMSFVDTAPETDEAYEVRIAGVLEGEEPKTYTYTVIAMAVGKPGCTAQLVSSTAESRGATARVAYRLASEELFLTGGEGEYEVLLTDEVGRTRSRGRISPGTPLRVGRLPRGIYVAQLHTHSGSGETGAVRFAVTQ